MKNSVNPDQLASSEASWSETNFKVRKIAKIRNQYNQVPHQTQDTNGKVTNSQSDITNESQEVSPFLAGDYKYFVFIQIYCKPVWLKK